MWITGIGTYLPAETRDNAYYARTTGLSEKRIGKCAGISTRRAAAIGEDAFTMALEAARNCFANANGSGATPDLIISGSYTPSDLIGTIAHRVQRALKLQNSRALYLSTACSSMLNAVEIAEGYFATGKSSVCLATASEHNSLYNDETDPCSGHLWGDGAGAFLLSAKPPPSGKAFRVLAITTHGHGADGHGPDGVYLKPHNGGLRMPFGADVFREATRTMASVAREALGSAGLTPADVNYFVPHQANQRITERVARELGFGPERVSSVIREFGNTGSASVVLALAQIAGKLRDGDHALLVTFGGGYSSAAMVVRAETVASDSKVPRVPDIQSERVYIEQLVAKSGPEPCDYNVLDEWFQCIHGKATRGELSADNLLVLRAAFGDAVSPDTLQGFVCHRPHGYLGDFEIIDKIYAGHVSPNPRLSRWDEYFHYHACSKAVRNRKAYFHALLDHHLGRCRPLRILNLASGPGRCIFEWLSARPDAEVAFHCVELDPKAIAYASTLNGAFAARITFQQKNAVTFRPTQQYDLIWSGGLFDYFSDRVFQSVLRRLLPALADGAELAIGNFASSNSSRAYMEFGGWTLQHRTADNLTSLATACGVSPAQIRIGQEPEGVNLFLHVLQQ